MGGSPTSRRRMRTFALAAGSAVVVTIASIGFTHMASAATVFTANFEDGSTSAWSKSGGTWAVASDGSRALQQTNAGSENARQFAGDTSWTNYTVQARVKPSSLGSGGHVGLLARASGSTKFYRLALLPGNQIQLQAVSGSSVTVLGSSSQSVSTGTWYTLALEVSGSTIRGLVNGSQIASASNSSISAGRIGLQTAYAAASFDDVTVNTSGGSNPTPTTPGPNPTTPAPTTPAPTTPPPNPPAGWPTPTGQVKVNDTISVPSSGLDGGLKRYYGIGDGGQGESQDPMFVLAPGATLRNVILGAPAGDGVHCEGNCTLINVWWEDVGEDAATFRGGTAYLVDGGGARSASDKVFQHNGGGTVTIRNFQVENAGKLYRGCGNCSTSYQRHVVMQNITARSTGALAGINTNWGDTARFSNITVYGNVTICQKWKGVPKGDEPDLIGSGPDGVNCLYSESDITRR